MWQLGPRSRDKELGTFRNGQVARIWVSSIDVLVLFLKNSGWVLALNTKLIIKTCFYYLIFTHQKNQAKFGVVVDSMFFFSMVFVKKNPILIYANHKSLWFLPHLLRSYTQLRWLPIIPRRAGKNTTFRQMRLQWGLPLFQMLNLRHQRPHLVLGDVYP